MVLIMENNYSLFDVIQALANDPELGENAWLAYAYFELLALV